MTLSLLETPFTGKMLGTCYWRRNVRKVRLVRAIDPVEPDPEHAIRSVKAAYNSSLSVAFGVLSRHTIAIADCLS